MISIGARSDGAAGILELLLGEIVAC